MDKKNFIVLEVIALILGVLYIFQVQFANSALFGADGYLHIRMAEFLRDYGLHYQFHWARFSTFVDNFSDKDFLFHVILIPFTYFSNIFYGAKLASAILASLLLGTIYIFLRRWSRRDFVFLFLLLLFISYKFIIALSRPRPFPLVIIFTILAIYFLIEKKRLPLFFIALAYCLTHISGPYMIVYCLMVESVRFITDKEIAWKNLAAVGLGVICGLLVHPYFPNNILVFYLNAILVPFYAARTGVLELGAEFFPIHSRFFFLSYPFFTLGLFAAFFFSLVKRPKVRFVTRVLFVFTCFYYLSAFMSQRYLIHGWPICVLFLGAYFSDLFSESQEGFTAKHASACFMASLGVLMLVFILYQGPTLSTRIRHAEAVNKHYENMAYFMQRYIPKGELIFHANWSDSQYFIGLNPDNDYYVTLDPVYMYYRDKVRYLTYRELAFGRAEDPYRLLKETFGTRFGYAGKNYFQGLINQVKKDSRFSILKEDELGILFALD